MLTLQWGEHPDAESGAQQAVQVTVAPVTIDIQSGAANVKYVLITQSRDIGILPASTGGTTTPALPSRHLPLALSIWRPAITTSI